MNSTSVRLFLFLAVLFLSCKGQQTVNKSSPEIKTIWVADHYGCQQGYIKACLLVKTTEQENYKDFNGTIEDFKYEAGNAYTLQVIETAPLTYKCMKVVDVIPAKNKGVKLASQWVLVGFYDEQNVLQYDSLKVGNIIIAEDLKSFTGDGGCNAMRGAVAVTDPNKIKLGPIESLRKKCPNNASEKKLIEALENTNTYKIDGGSIIFYNNQMPLIQFESYRN